MSQDNAAPSAAPPATRVTNGRAALLKYARELAHVADVVVALLDDGDVGESADRASTSEVLWAVADVHATFAAFAAMSARCNRENI